MWNLKHISSQILSLWFLTRPSSHSIMSNYIIFLQVINFTIFFSRPLFLFVKIILNSSPVSLLNSNNYNNSSIILVINDNIQLYSVQNRSHQSHEFYWMSPIVIMNIGRGLTNLETGRVSYLSKHCSKRRRGKAYWQYIMSYRVLYVINCSGVSICYICAAYLFSLLQYSFLGLYIAHGWEKTILFWFVFFNTNHYN